MLGLRSHGFYGRNQRLRNHRGHASEVEGGVPFGGGLSKNGKRAVKKKRLAGQTGRTMTYVVMSVHQIHEFGVKLLTEHFNALDRIDA